MATATAAPMPIPAPAPAEIPDEEDDADEAFVGGVVAVGEAVGTVADPWPTVGVKVAKDADETAEEREAVALASMADESMDQ